MKNSNIKYHQNNGDRQLFKTLIAAVFSNSAYYKSMTISDE